MIEDQAAGLNRRDVLRRGAILGGALVWTVPAVQTLAGPAFAAGTAPCEVFLTTSVDGVCERTDFVETPECCNCVATQTANTGSQTAAVILCAVGIGGNCQIDGAPGPC